MTMMLAILLQVVPQPVPPFDASRSEIVITGKSLADRERSLAACKAKACPPDEEIRAAVALASQQFVDGNIVEARHTLLASRARNARFASRYPIQVADLHRGLVTMSGLDGRPYSARVSTFDATDALQAGLAADDYRILLQRLETGDQLASDGQIADSVRLYDSIAARAHQMGYTEVEAVAMFRAATLYAAASSYYSEYRGAARRRAALIERRTEPEFDQFRDALTLVKIKLASLKADPDDRKRVIATANLPSVNEAILLFETINRNLGSTLGLSGNTSEEPEWADVAFWVRPDGSVSGPEVVDRSQATPGPWLNVKLKAVGDRRYAPLKRLPGDQGIYVVERYTMVHNTQARTGSAIKGRALTGTVFTTNMTGAHPTPASLLQ